jgi:hypothetical protein
MSNHVRQRDKRRGGSRSAKAARCRATRPKTFKSEEAAKKWAESQKITKYSIVNLKNPESASRKLRVVPEAVKPQEAQ